MIRLCWFVIKMFISSFTHSCTYPYYICVIEVLLKETSSFPFYELIIDKIFVSSLRLHPFTVVDNLSPSHVPAQYNEKTYTLWKVLGLKINFNVCNPFLQVAITNRIL